MIIHRIDIKKFMSLENTSVDLPASGIISIRGKVGDDENSSNGAGKSALVESIFWVLFGKTLRGASSDKKWNVSIEGVTTDNRKFRIERNSSKLNVEIEKLNIKANLKSELQDIIIREILNGVSWRTFSMMTFFTPFTITKWFTQMGDSDKKGILLEVLDIDWLDRVYERVRNDISDVETRLSSLHLEHANISGQIEGLSSGLKTSIERELELVKDDLEMVRNIVGIQSLTLEDIPKKAIPHLQHDLAILERLKDEVYNSFTSVNTYLVSNNRKQVALTTQMTNIQTELQFFRENSECPTCHRPIDDQFRNEKIQELQAKLDELAQQKTILLKEYKELETEYNSLNTVLEAVKRVINAYNRIISLRSESAKSEVIARLKAKLNEIEYEQKELKNLLEILMKWKDVFSSTGVKSDVVETIFKAIADKTKEYAELIGLVGFKQSMRKGRISYDNYKNLSSGERRRAEIALMFALRDVIPFPADFLVIDEIFDHLDWTGIQSVVPLVDMQSQDKQIFVISHRPDLGFPSVAKRILVHKENGVSTIKEDEL